ncbi:hypothetical protein 13AC503A_gene0053 [Aeromonas phage 13AC503A]|nr:hypothetical protein 13AC503A_gene0053 [Aeromonas phage 13AC503A]
MAKLQPKGIRRNNPGNLEWGSPWQGLAAKGDYPEDRFAAFVDPAYGIRAIAVTLITYQDKRKAKDGSRIDSVREVIERWAPSDDNNDVPAYAKSVAALLDGVGPNDEVLDMHNPVHLRALVEGIIRHENGRGPLNTPNTWYPADVITEALRRAGVVSKPTAGATVTKAVPAAALGGVGAEQLTQAIPSVLDALSGAKVDLSSGNWVQVVVGGAMLCLSLAMIYHQYRQHRDGVA